MKKRTLSVFLCIVLCLSLFSGWAFAEGEEASGDVIVEEEIVTEEPAAEEADGEEPAEEEIVEENDAEEEIVEEVVEEPAVAAAEKSQEAGTASFDATLNMADYTGIFVYIGLPDGANASEYTVEASGASYRQSFVKGPTAVSSLPKGSGSRANMYRFEAMRAASTEMTDEVTVTVKKGSQVVQSKSFSVYSVAEEKLENGGLPDNQVNLFKSLLQYGYYGHIVFNNPLPFNPVIDGAPALTEIPSSYAPKNDPTGFGAYVTKFEEKLNLNSEIAMNLYLTLADGYSMSDFTFCVTDQNGSAYGNCSVSAQSGNRVAVKIGGIKSPQMAKHFNIGVSLKSNPSKAAVWTRSVWTCAYMMTDRLSGDSLNLVQALYQYGLCAQEVFPGMTDPDPTTAVIGDLIYELTGADSCLVKKYTGNAAELTVPETLPANDPAVPPVFRGAGVTGIGQQAFEGNTKLTSIDLPDTVSVIAARAFAGCTSLSKMS